MRKYTIPSGLHISHIFPSFYKDRPVLNFTFRFSSNCLYSLGSVDEDLKCNKLYGMSFGPIHNTTTLWGRLFSKRAHSFRLGWNCEKQNGKIQLFAYYYNAGVRKIEYICDICVSQTYNCFMYFDRTSNKILVDVTGDGLNINTSYYFRFNDCLRWGLFLFPFFGGDMAAPNKMNMYINKLN